MKQIQTKKLEALVQRHSTTFYTAFKDLPEKKRNAVFAVYGFCRHADDLVDVEHDEDKLEEFANELLHFSNGVVKDSLIWTSLKEVFDTYDMNVDPFFEMMDGQKMDLHFMPFETIGHLEQYCYFVAGTVGMMLLPILATEHHRKLPQAAIDLGIAMQLTNILRDVGEDADLGRCYIPLELLLDHDLEVSEVLEKQMSDRFISAWEDLAHLAESKYDRFETYLHLFDEDSQKALLDAAQSYRKILDDIRGSGYKSLVLYSEKEKGEFK